MKRLLFVSLLLLMIVAAGNAQQDYGVEVSVSSGLVFPSSPMTFANYWSMQYGGGVQVGVPLSQTMTVFGSVEHYQFKLNQQGISDGFDTNYMRDIWIFKSVSMHPSADPSMVTAVSANVRVTPSRLSAVLSPYFVGGVGVLRFSLSEIKLPTTSVLSVNSSDIAMTAQQGVTGGVETSVFFQFGMGFAVKMSETFDLFVEARYASGMNSGLRTTYMPVTGGVKMRL